MAHYLYEGLHFELPDGLSNDDAIKKIETHLGKTKASAAIPGQEGEAARVAALKAQPQPTIGDKLLGAGEAALSTATGLFAGAQAPVAGLIKGAFGMVPDAEKETARLMEQQTYRPRTEKGQDYAENVGKVINDVLAPLGPGNLAGLAQARPIPGLLRGEKPANKPMPSNREAILNGNALDDGKLKPDPVNRYEQMVRDLGAEPTPKETPFSGMVEALSGRPRIIDPEFKMAPEELAYVKQAAEAARDDALVARLEAAIAKQNPEQAPFAVTPEGYAYRPDLGTELGRNTLPIEQGRGLSTGENAVGTGKNIERPQGPSGLMGLPERPVEPHVGLSLGENTPGSGPGPARPMGPSNLMGEPIPPVKAPVGLSTGEGTPGGRNIEHAPVTDSGLMGVQAPTPFDPFGSAGSAAPLRKTGRFGQQGGIQMDLLLPKKLVDMLYKWRDAGGRMLIPDITRMVADSGAKLDDNVRSILIEKYKDNDITQRYLNRIQKALDSNDYDRAQSRYKNLDNHLMTVLINEEEQGYNRYSPEQQEYRAKTGLYSKRDQARTEYERTINKFGQGGSAPIINDLAQGVVNVGRSLKAKFTGEAPPKPDTILTPRSDATIAAKQEKASKAAAIGLKDSVYSAPSTIEEVLANPGKDLTTSLQDLTPGKYSVIRKNAANNVLKYTNRLFTEARLNKVRDSVALITSKGAYNDLLKALSPEERMQVHQDALFLDKNNKPWNDAKAEALGYTPAMKAFMDWRIKAHETVANKADAVLAEQGLKPLNRRQSYAPSNYDPAYTALVTQKTKDGKLKVVIPLNGNSLWEIKKAIAWAKEKYSGAEYNIGEIQRRGLKTEVVKKYSNPAKDGITRLFDEMAKLDPNMQAAKAELDSWIQGQTQKLYGHDVHLLRKQGLEGSIGDRPWLDAKRNAEDFFAQEVNHIEEALQYWNYQKPVNEARQLAADPKIAQMKNTVKYLDRYMQHVTGQGLNPLGAALNWTVDKLFAIPGKGSAKTVNTVTNTTREAATLWMMGVWNPTFMSVQLSQTATGMLPEALRIRSEYGLPPETLASSLNNSMFNLTMMAVADVQGKLDSGAFAPHLVEGYKWMKEHGLTRYNEVEQSHAATQNPKWHTVKKGLSLPITIPETMTTPQAFMWAVDMLHEAGKTGNDLYLSAYNAAKYAMTDYHPDEAPMVYQRLGVVGQHVGGLKKFVHNAVDQQASRTMELAKHPAAFSAMLGMTFLTMGAMGLAGVGMLDKLSLSLTDKGLRDHYDDMFGASKIAHGMRDGFLSVLTGYDLQTRYSMADLVPNSFGEAVAGPHISKLAKMGMSLIEYGMNPSEASFREMSKQMVPSGLAGTLEENMLLGPQGQVLDKEAQNKYPASMNRTPKEHFVRELGGPRPLRERLYDEQKYQADVVQRRIEEKRNKASKDMLTAVGFNDQEGFKAAMDNFIKNEGDLSTLDQKIQTYMENKGLSSKQRAAGTPTENISTIKRFQRYQER